MVVPHLLGGIGHTHKKAPKDELTTSPTQPHRFHQKQMFSLLKGTNYKIEQRVNKK